MLKEGKTSQVFLDAPKVFNKALSQNMPSFADVDGWAKVTGNPVDEARSLAGKSLLDDNGGSGALEVGVSGNVVTGTPTGCVRCSCLTKRLAGIRSVHQNVLEVSVVAVGNCSGCGKTALMSGSTDKMAKLCSRILVILSFDRWLTQNLGNPVQTVIGGPLIIKDFSRADKPQDFTPMIVSSTMSLP